MSGRLQSRNPRSLRLNLDLFTTRFLCLSIRALLLRDTMLLNLIRSTTLPNLKAFIITATCLLSHPRCSPSNCRIPATPECHLHNGFNMTGSSIKIVRCRLTIFVVYGYYSWAIGCPVFIMIPRDLLKFVWDTYSMRMLGLQH